MTTDKKRGQRSEVRKRDNLTPSIILSAVIRHLSSVLCPLSSVLCHPSSVFCHPSSVFCLLSSVICLLFSVICLLFSVICLQKGKHDSVMQYRPEGLNRLIVTRWMDAVG